MMGCHKCGTSPCSCSYSPGFPIPGGIGPYEGCGPQVAVDGYSGEDCGGERPGCGPKVPDCSPPVPKDCAGGDCTTIIDPRTGCPIPAPGVCAPGLYNIPNTDKSLEGSLGVCLQPVIDGARGIIHDLGLRGYRVFLIWQKRDNKQRFVEFKRIQLYPVKVTSLTGVGWQSSPSGMLQQGEITISEISPAQADGRTLFGQVQELNYSLDPDIEFFYEVQPRDRCASDALGVQPARFTPSSLPYYDAEGFQWVVDLVDQEAPQTQPPPASDTPDRDGTFQPQADTLRARRGRKRSPLRT